ncbi:DNA-binding IclR family transcriptional regulator [Caldalkalibacillus uzonensis]|uniref:DNA-binding IclR family transcriptional regulator n=1 Tax=Caldalkalibacillus uzonensis TaxID=353224 RepID=A0ABU0CPG1_9BACI|nr:IclR family transcriptional regulator [Caldalkalibacillus uzonensis]MDQ0338279.1 DNA-binding IclR family transcriptional regulator [Caldalkalibacillus uzonensis]
MKETKGLINAVDRALRILDLFTDQQPELKLTEISKTLNLHKSTVHGLLRTLAYHGYISQNPETGKYRLGLKFLEKSDRVLHALDLRKIANPHLQKIANKYGESTHLVILEGGEAIYIDKIEGHLAIGMYSRISKRAPIYCTAVGKVLVSEKPEWELKEIAQNQNYIMHTKNTIKNADELLEEIRRVRELGYGMDDEELEIGLRCIAVPVRNNTGSIVAAISISGPTMRLSNKVLPEVVDSMKKAAAQISSELGYQRD